MPQIQLYVLYLEYVSVCHLVRIGTHPHPILHKQVCPSSGTKEGAGGGWVPIPTTGEKASHSVYSVCSPVLCVLHEANDSEHEEAGQEGVA